MADQKNDFSTFHGWAAPKAKAALEPITFKPRALTAHDVTVKVTHCGICYSDVHLIDGDWGAFSQYPIVVGHEVVGTVAEVGADVRHLKVGDRVGIGWQGGACLECYQCMSGDDNLCAQNVPVPASGNRGGYADYIRVQSEYAFKIPEKLKSEHAAPLMCGGVTVFTPIMEYTKPGDRVGIVGIGGLGHMAVKFAAARGCVVTGFSTSKKKEDEIKKMGARYVLSSVDKDELKAAARSLDSIIITAHADLDWDMYLSLLRPRGKLIFVGAVPNGFKVSNIFPMLIGNIQVIGSNIGSRHVITDMLEFAAEFGIEPIVEVVDFKNVNEALTRLRKNDVRYRFVLKH